MKGSGILIAILLLGCALAAAQPDAVQPKDLDLFLLIGQSNMAGRGTVEDQDKVPIPHVYSLDKDLHWVPAVDPLHFDRPKLIGVGLGRSFARTLLAANPEASIGLIPAALGGSKLSQWEPGGELYTEAVRRARAAMRSGHLRGILWHQGESDTNSEEEARTYRDRFTAFLAALRKDLGAEDVPVVVGQLGEFFEPPLAAVVNEQLATIPLHIRRTAFVSSAGLTDRGDRIHFNSASYREFGRRYALAYLSLDPTWGTVR